jgi:hypothetical protein
MSMACSGDMRKMEGLHHGEESACVTEEGISFGDSLGLDLHVSVWSSNKKEKCEM